MQSHHQISGSRLLAVALCVFVVVYFVLPSFLFRACEAVLGPRSESSLMVVFTPITYLCDNIPLYEAFMQKEAALTGVGFVTLPPSRT